MQTIWDSELALIYALQNWAPWLERPMQWLSLMGRAEFYLIIMPLIYWCWDERLGRRVGWILLLSASLNQTLKWFFHQPRPYWLPASIQALSAEPTFGFPSGHAQHAMAVWGMLAAHVRKRWQRWALILLIVLIGISRVWLGVHFPHDVLAGWFTGGLLLWATLVYGPRLEKWFERARPRQRVLSAFGLGLGMLALGALALQLLPAWTLPPAWADQALLISGEAIDPSLSQDLLTSGGVLLGMLLGMAWLERRGGLDTSGSITQRVLRYVMGIVIVALLWLAGHWLDVAAWPVLDGLVRYLRYALIGFWVAGGAPAAFIALGLARPRQDPTERPAASV